MPELILKCLRSGSCYNDSFPGRSVGKSEYRSANRNIGRQIGISVGKSEYRARLHQAQIAACLPAQVPRQCASASTVQGAGCRAQGAGRRVQGAGCRAQRAFSASASAGHVLGVMANLKTTWNNYHNPFWQCRVRQQALSWESGQISKLFGTISCASKIWFVNAGQEHCPICLAMPVNNPRTTLEQP